ncbi:hypothetical protein ACKI1Q_44595, partial [Streptomyces galilaeus]|uniref:hypothetical protein n=1 Tax=Streptomyces galilaeus TaxID=33899 RepID=UPI0038F775DA
AYLEDRKPTAGYERTLPAADLPLLFAAVTIAERDRAKAEKAREAEKAGEVDPYAAHRKASGANPATPRATRPSPAPEATAAPTEPPKP